MTSNLAPQTLAEQHFGPIPTIQARHQVISCAPESDREPDRHAARDSSHFQGYTRCRLQDIQEIQASIGYNCTGVAVASSKLFRARRHFEQKRQQVLGIRLLMLTMRPEVLAPCSMGFIDNNTLIFELLEYSTTSDLLMINPCGTMPTRLGHFLMPSGPAAGYSMPCSSTHCWPVHTAKGMSKRFCVSSCHSTTASLAPRPARDEYRKAPSACLPLPVAMSCVIRPYPPG